MKASCWILGHEDRPQSETILDQGLQAARIRRTDCYMPKGEPQHLHALIRQHRPKLIIALGNAAFRVAMGHMPEEAVYPDMTEIRGYLWDSPLGPRVIGLTRPSFITREGNWVPYHICFTWDMQKAGRELAAGCPPLPVYNTTIVTRPVEGVALKEAVRGASRIAIDIETTADPRAGELELACLGVAVDNTTAFTIPWGEKWQEQLMRWVCEDPTPKALQNGAYDLYFLKYLRFQDGRIKYGMDFESSWAYDTMLMWHILQPGLAGQEVNSKSKVTRKSLQFLASLMSRAPFWKDYAFESEEERYRLCGQDCGVTLECCGALEQALEGG